MSPSFGEVFKGSPRTDDTQASSPPSFRNILKALYSESHGGKAPKGLNPE